MGSMDFKKSVGFLKASIEKALCFLHAFNRTHQNSTLPTVGSQSSPTRWIPPAMGWLMLNTDAAYHQSGSSYGFVLQDHEGKVLKSGVRPLECITTAEHAELMALWRSFDYISEFWNQPLIIATNCKHLVSQINCMEQNLSCLRGLVGGLRSQFQKAPNWKVVFSSSCFFF